VSEENISGGTTKTDLDNLIQQAESFYLNGNAEKALILLQDILSAAPNHPRVLNNLGLIFLSRGKFHEARSIFENLIEVEPNHPEGNKNLVLTMMGLKEFLSAKTFLEKLLAHNQADFFLWALLAKVESTLGFHQNALNHAKRSLLLNPDQKELSHFVNRLEEKESPKFNHNVIPQKKIKLAFFLSPETNNEEIDLLAPYLNDYFQLEKVLSLKTEVYVKVFSDSEIIWLEGLNPISNIFLTENFNFEGKKIFLRLSREDILNRAAKNPNFTKASRIVFPGFYLRDHFLQHKPSLTPGTPLHVIPKALDLKNYPYTPTKTPDKIGAVVNEFTDPGEFIYLLEAFQTLYQTRQALKFHLFLGSRNMERETHVSHYIFENNLGNSIYFHGSGVLAKFLTELDYILSTSAFAENRGVPEALLMGAKPLIRQSLGSNDFFPETPCFKNLSELIQIFQNPPDTAKISQMLSSTLDPKLISQKYVSYLSN
jgi:tetratricopeptide (TPR) repeat protein